MPAREHRCRPADAGRHLTICTRVLDRLSREATKGTVPKRLRVENRDPPETGTAHAHSSTDAMRRSG
jgi:hypothetical protein